MKYCPNCEKELNADTEVFVMGKEVVGCEWCMRSTWADEFFDEEELYDMEQDRYDNYLWDMSQEMKALLNHKAGVGND